MDRKTPNVPSKSVCNPGRQLPDETIEERRARQVREGLQAMADYRAAEAALRDRTKKLRAMREAQQANSSAPNEGAPGPKNRPRRSGTSKHATGNFPDL